MGNVATFIPENSASYTANRHASGVGLMPLVDGRANEKARSCSRSAVRRRARARITHVHEKGDFTPQLRIMDYLNGLRVHISIIQNA